jgi:hypothetical protein
MSALDEGVTTAHVLLSEARRLHSVRDPNGVVDDLVNIAVNILAMYNLEPLFDWRTYDYAIVEPHEVH